MGIYICISLLNGKVGYIQFNTTHSPFITQRTLRKQKSVHAFQKFLSQQFKVQVKVFLLIMFFGHQLLVYHHEDHQGVVALAFLLSVLAMQGKGLLKYLDVLHRCSLNGFGCLMFGLKFGFGGNIALCLWDTLHLRAKLWQIPALLMSSLSKGESSKGSLIAGVVLTKNDSTSFLLH